jgi:hypothetical protein
MWWTKTSAGLRAWFVVTQGNGSLRTGLVGGDFTAAVVEPGDAATTAPTVSESTQKAGLYTFLVPSAFLVTNGAGEYGVSIEVDTFAGPSGSPNVRDAVGHVLRVSLADLDDLAQPGDAMTLTGAADAAIATAVWSEALPGAFGAGEAGKLAGDSLDAAISSRATQADILSDATPFPGASIDAAISSRSSHSAGDVDTTLSASHGAGSWQSASASAVATAVWSEALPGAFGAGEAGKLAGDSLDAAISSRATQADILSDATPFPGASIDAAISSRSSHSAADVDTTLSGSHGAGSWEGATAAAVTAAVWGEALPGAFGVGEAGRLVGDNLDAAVSTRSSHSAADVDTTLSGSHGAGSWEGATAAAVTAAVWGEALPGAFGAGEAGQIVGDNLNATISSRAAPGDAMALTAGAESDVVDAVWDEAIAGHLGAGSTGKALQDAGATADPGAIADAVWDEPIAGHQSAGTMGRAANAISVESTVGAAPAPTSTEFATGLTQANGYWNGATVVVVYATGEAVPRRVTNFTQANGLFLVPALPAAPTVGDVVIVIRRAVADDIGDAQMEASGT